jgi:uncharacterized protein (DUF1800 family)
VTSPSRRDLLRLTAAGAAVGVTAGSGLLAATTSAAAAGPAGSLVPASLDVHLARRATFGATPDVVAQIRRMGRRAWVDKQLNPGSINDAACSRMLTERFPGLNWNITQARRHLVPFSWDLMFDVGVATVARATWSKRQLFEVMVEFWSNLLHVTNPSDRVWDNRQDYDRTVLRKHALGRFEDMLVASARHPSMLLYLNNAESTRFEPNENYGRELLELHSVGVDAGYTEDEMLQSALIMTGFGVDWETGLFEYSAWNHYRGRVGVLGFSHSNRTGTGGKDVATAYLKYLARHPATARRIATKLCERFVSDTPPAALVDKLASVYRANGTAIKPVLRTLFASSAFTSSVGKKVRRPLEDMTGTLRILDYGPDKSGVEGMRGLYWMADGLGHAPQTWHQPDGFPDVAVAWQSAGTTLGRWNMHLSLAAHWWPSQLTQPKLRRLLPKKLPATHGALVDALSQRLVFRRLSTPHRRAVLTFMGRSASDPLSPDDAAVDWRLPYIVALILDSPYNAVR